MNEITLLKNFNLRMEAGVEIHVTLSSCMMTYLGVEVTISISSQAVQR